MSVSFRYFMPGLLRSPMETKRGRYIWRWLSRAETQPENQWTRETKLFKLSLVELVRIRIEQIGYAFSVIIIAFSDSSVHLPLSVSSSSMIWHVLNEISDLHGGGWARKNESLRNILQRYKITPSANMYTELQKAELRVHIGIQALRDDQNATNGGELIVPWTNEPQELDFSNGKVIPVLKNFWGVIHHSSGRRERG